MKKIKLFIILFVALFVVTAIIFTAINAFFMLSNPIELKCFDTIEDLEFLNEYVTDEFSLSKDKIIWGKRFV